MRILQGVVKNTDKNDKKWYSDVLNVKKSWEQGIKSDVLERKNEKNMLNLNISSVICNETVKLCIHISLWSDKKKKKFWIRKKNLKGKII